MLPDDNLTLPSIIEDLEVSIGYLAIVFAIQNNSLDDKRFQIN